MPKEAAVSHREPDRAETSCGSDLCHDVGTRHFVLRRQRVFPITIVGPLSISLRLTALHLSYSKGTGKGLPNKYPLKVGLGRVRAHRLVVLEGTAHCTSVLS